MVETVTATTRSSDGGGPSLSLAGRNGATDRTLRLVWRVSLGLLALQLLGMLVFTTVQYQRFDLTNDFATYSQAWSGIAHGHLIAYNSTLREAYWRNDFELLMWPLALFYWVFPHTIVLLWLQALAVVGGELVVLSWALEALVKTAGSGRSRAQVLGFVTLLLVATPWSWLTIAYDFHLEPFATLFALLAARALWAGRHRQLWLWVPLTLICCAAPGSLFVIAVGLAGLLSRNSSRLMAIAVVAAGCTWLAFTTGIGATDFGGGVHGSMYAYLAGSSNGHFGSMRLLEGLVRHPSRAIDMFRSHDGYVTGYVASGGVIGLRSRWGLLPAAFVLLPSALNANPAFIMFGSAYQSWAAVLFLVVGSAFALRHIVSGGSSRAPLLVLGGVTLVLAVAMTTYGLTLLPGYIQRVTPAAEVELATVQRLLPARAEVVVSQGIIGRFSVGRSAYFYWPSGSPEKYPVEGDHEPVVFILSPDEGTSDGNPAETRQAIGYIESRLHAQVMTKGAGVWALTWAPKGSTKTVVLP